MPLNNNSVQHLKQDGVPRCMHCGTLRLSARDRWCATVYAAAHCAAAPMIDGVPRCMLRHTAPQRP
eukprot:3321236-Alexandrium_andersonii.AAC.1